jgi:uncharacterized Zn-binding protein involved in type VI secretion
MPSLICVGRTYLSTYEPRWTQTAFEVQDVPSIYLPDVPGNDTSNFLPWLNYNGLPVGTKMMPVGFVGLTLVPDEYMEIPNDLYFSFKPSIISYLEIYIDYYNREYISQGLPDIAMNVVPSEQWFRINGQPVVTDGDSVKYWYSVPGIHGRFPAPALDIPAITPLMPYPPYDPTWTGFSLLIASIKGESHWKVNGKPMAQFGISTAEPLGVNFFSGQCHPFFSA